MHPQIHKLINDKQLQALLRQYVHRDKLLGPIDALEIRQKEAQDFLFSYQEDVYKKEDTHPVHIVGRRGSGKTAYLKHIEAQDRYHILVEIDKSQAIQDLIYKVKAVAPSVVLVEEAAKYWDLIFYSSILHELKKRYPNEVFGDYWLKQYYETLAKRPIQKMATFLNKLFDRMASAASPGERSIWTGLFGTAADLTDHPVDHLKNKVIELCSKNEIKAIILIDSLEDYRLDVEESKIIMQGFLKATARFNVRRKEPEIRCCVPSELYYSLRSISTNSQKDFPKPMVLHWSSHDLCAVALNRIQLHQVLYDDGNPLVRGNILTAELGDRNEVFSTLRSIFIGKVVNENGAEEDPLTFILRHTQLIPRQLIDLLHSIFKENIVRGTGEMNVCSPEVVREAVRGQRSNLADGIYNAYRYQYPQVERIIKETLRRLPRKEKYTLSEFESLFAKYIKGRKFLEGADLEEGDYTRMLAEVGCLGSVIDETDYYINVLFEFNSRSEVEFDFDSEICVHPVFRSAWLEGSVDSPLRAVMPRGIDPGSE